MFQQVYWCKERRAGDRTTPLFSVNLLASYMIVFYICIAPLSRPRIPPLLVGSGRVASGVSGGINPGYWLVFNIIHLFLSTSGAYLVYFNLLMVDIRIIIGRQPYLPKS